MMEKLFRFLQRFFKDRFYGSITIKFQAGKVTHVETMNRRTFEYKELPQ